MKKPMCDSTEQKVWHYVHNNPMCDRDDVQKSCSLNSYVQASQILYSLEAKKMISRTTSNPPLWCAAKEEVEEEDLVSIHDVPIEKLEIQPKAEISPFSPFATDIKLRALSPFSPNLEHVWSPSAENKKVLGNMTTPQTGTKRPSSVTLANTSKKPKIETVVKEEPVSNVSPFIEDDSSEDLEPISLLNHIASRYSLMLTFRDFHVSTPKPVWQAKCLLQDAADPKRGIQSEGFSELSNVAAKGSAALKLLKIIAGLSGLPFASLASEYLLKIEKNTLRSSTELFSPGEQIAEKYILKAGETYPGEENAFMEFKGSKENGGWFDYIAFKNCFKQCVWEYITAFINLHADGNKSTIDDKVEAKIVFGIHDRGNVQGVRFSIPPGSSKQETLRKIKDLYSRKIVDLAYNLVQPKEITSCVRVNLEEVVDSYAFAGFTNDSFLAIVEVIITVPNFPTVCSYRDTFFYRQLNAGSVSKMTLSQLHARFTMPNFKLVA